MATVSDVGEHGGPAASTRHYDVPTALLSQPPTADTVRTVLGSARQAVRAESFGCRSFVLQADEVTRSLG